ncbi:hypothetical protein D9V80_01310 [Buchnera aphidicola (Thelaxes californica)]|uniref:FlgD Ig-like domain-containing protein n=1 Tax=Buchnera aphidicola (Thelaxes californica) TaxID=1315998 RepID=A0A4D6YLE6_9GAMM|nr:hypothetical protein [Buchnera aphidicola]QCI26794.1 hypothetical protein D9V80_01310 [Buchnera aphidicola (Thelaxes californica)]
MLINKLNNVSLLPNSENQIKKNIDVKNIPNVTIICKNNKVINETMFSIHIPKKETQKEYDDLNSSETFFEKKYCSFEHTLKNIKNSIKIAKKNIHNYNNISNNIINSINTSSYPAKKIILMPSDEIVLHDDDHLVKIGYQLVHKTDMVYIRISKKNNDGIIYKKIKPMYVGMHIFNWDCLDQTKKSITPGTYDIKIFAKKDNTVFEIQPLIPKKLVRLTQ